MKDYSAAYGYHFWHQQAVPQRPYQNIDHGEQIATDRHEHAEEHLHFLKKRIYPRSAPQRPGGHGLTSMGHFLTIKRKSLSHERTKPFPFFPIRPSSLRSNGPHGCKTARLVPATAEARRLR